MRTAVRVQPRLQLFIKPRTGSGRQLISSALSRFRVVLELAAQFISRFGFILLTDRAEFSREISCPLDRAAYGDQNGNMSALPCGSVDAHRPAPSTTVAYPNDAPSVYRVRDA
jgi:hypothetical protein